MAKLWPVFVIAAAAVGAAVLMFGGEDGGGYVEEDEIVGYDEHGNPILMTTEGRPRPKEDSTPPPVQPEDPKPDEPKEVLFLEGIVIDAVSKKPIAGATLSVEQAQDRCPRLPGGPGTWVPFPQSSSDGHGRFRWMVPAARMPAVGLDLFVLAPRHVIGVLCKVTTGSHVTVPLQRALQQGVQVTDLHGRPVEAAKLRVVPAEGTPALPGHAGQAVTDRNGSAEIDGLTPGDVMLEADHPEFMPATIGPFDPADGDELTVRLAPALRLKFEIRSDDASEVKNPTLAWQTNGTPAHTGLQLLKAMPAGPENDPLSEVHSEVVRIPCDHREVRFELKADGFEPWTPEPEPLPVEGGERTIIASLRRDASLGALRIKFEDADGEPVNYAKMQAVPGIARLDERPISSGIVLETAETLHFPAIPAGPYRVGVRSPGYAPGEVDVTVRAGEENEALIKLTPPAKLKIQFVANEKVLVRFRLLQQGRVVPAFPEGVPSKPDETGVQPLVVQGNEGTVFTGLPPGALVIQVTSPELTAAPHTVHLRAGETVETEIQVRFR